MQTFVAMLQVVPFSEALMKVFRDHGDRTDRQKARLIWLVERVGNEKFVEMMKEYMDGAEFGPEVHPTYTDEWKRRDVLGVHPQKQEGLSWVRNRLLCCPNLLQSCIMSFVGLVPAVGLGSCAAHMLLLCICCIMLASSLNVA
jgi:Nitrite and sulphite reductase 4Fe-4S domain